MFEQDFVRALYACQHHLPPEYDDNLALTWIIISEESSSPFEPEIFTASWQWKRKSEKA